MPTAHATTITTQSTLVDDDAIDKDVIYFLKVVLDTSTVWKMSKAANKSTQQDGIVIGTSLFIS